MVFLNHGGGSFDHIQKSVIFIMIRYLFRLHFHFALSILKMIRRTVPAIRTAIRRTVPAIPKMEKNICFNSVFQIKPILDVTSANQSTLDECLI